MNTMLSHTQIICIGIIASLAAGLATGAGAIPIFFTRNISKKLMDALLGMAAGIMLAATAFSLIIPAIEKGGGGIKGAGITLIGILVGGIFLDVVDRLFPDTNLLSNSMNDAENENGAALRRVWLFVIAITVHNFPEGMAVGVGFGDGDIANGISLAIAIGLQNIPEGLAVALPLLQHGYSTGKTFLTALATGLVEPIGGLIGVCIIQLSRPLLPFIMAFAAGAMLFVITEEIIPEIHNHQYCSKLATHALLIGFVIMMFLDNVLG
jgi:ZIP family zinc transporter